MLVHATHGRPDLTRRTFLLIAASIAGGALTALLPLPGAAEPTETLTDDQKPLSRIFVRVFLRKENAFESLVVAVDPVTGKWQRLMDGEDVFSVRLSPDRERLLFARHNDGVWTCSARDGSTLARVMYTGFGPIWSPDGKEIIAHDGKYEEGNGWKHSNWRMKADGADLTRLPVPDADGIEDWSADGKWVVTVSDRHPPQGSGYQLYVMRPDGTQERRITQDGLNVYARFSPDSRSLAYTHQHKGINSLWIVNIDGTQAREILREEGLTGVGASCWSPDGKQLVVQRYNWELDEKGQKIRRAGNDHDFHLEIIDADGQHPRDLRLEDLRPIDVGHPEWR